MSQVRIIKLQCISCGGKLEVSPDMERFTCGYCGTEQIVERRGGTISLKGVAQAISRVQAGTDKTAAELALNRLERELESLNNKRARLRTQAENEKKSNTKLMIWIFVGSAIVGGATTPHGTRSDTFPPGVILVLIGIVIGIIVKVSRDKKVKERFNGELQGWNAHANDIHEKMAKNREIVDS
jgi:hypothetical protein